MTSSKTSPSTFKKADQESSTGMPDIITQADLSSQEIQEVSTVFPCLPYIAVMTGTCDDISDALADNLLLMPKTLLPISFVDTAFSSLTQLIRPSLYRPSLFHVVKFPNDECLDATNQTGVCYTGLECKAFGGTGSTACANGYGTCCTINRSCNQVNTNKVVYFMNPSYPQFDTASQYCAFTTEIPDPEVCQIRLDFLEFNVDQPTDGLCVGDRLTVTAAGLNARSIPVLCGNNKDQHMYVNIPRGSNRQRSASLLMQTNGSGSYKWRIRITHVSCVRSPGDADVAFANSQSSASTTSRFSSLSSNSIARRNDPQTGRMLSKLRFLPMSTLKVTLPAPSGCLQYFTQPSGTITNFNYGQYLSNMDYAICIERHPTACKVIFRSTDAFGISMSTGSKQFYAGVGDNECLYDYLAIPGGARDGMRETRDRRCGTIFANTAGTSSPEAVVSRSNGPIVLRFHTDSLYDRDVKSGFKISYEQSGNCENVITDQNMMNQSPYSNAFMYASPATPAMAASLLEEQPSFQTHINSNKLTLEEQQDRETRSRSNAKRWKF